MKKKLTLLALIIFSMNLFAQSAENLVDAIKEKDLDGIRTILTDSSEEDAPLFEQLILEESRKEVRKDNLDYAYALAEIVLMYNFDNEEAQNLYTSIEKAKKSKAEVAAKEAEKERKRLEEEEQKRKIEEYQAFKQEEETKKIEQEKAVTTITKTNFPILIGISPAAFTFQKSQISDLYKGNSSFDFKYGAGIFVNAGFTHPYFMVNLHANYNFSFISFNGNGMKSDFESRFTVGSPIVSNIIRLSAGYNWISYINSNKSVVLTDSYGAHIGIGFEDLKIGNSFVFTLFADFNTLTFTSTRVDLAFDVDFTCRYNLPFVLFTKRFYIESNTVFNTVQISQKWEYSVDSRIVLGVYLNE